MKSVFVLGQALPRTDPGRPFGRTALYKWLAEAGLDNEFIAEHFSFAALINYFPGSVKGGSHLAPTPQQIAEERPVVAARIKAANPTLFVPVGTLAIRETLQNPTLTLDRAVGQSFMADPLGVFGRQIPIIPLPHPSGASPWVYLGDNKLLLSQALHLLKVELNR